MNNNSVKMFLTVLVTASIVFVLTSSYYINNVVSGNQNTPIANTVYSYSGDFTKLKKVLSLVDRDFLFTGYDKEELEEGAIKGMLSALEDPYTSYFTKNETEEFLLETQGSYDGVGMYVTYGTEYDWPMVLATIKGSPASEAGIKPGDYIFTVSGEDINGSTSLEEVASRLKGTPGTVVSVTFVRIHEDKRQEKYTVELERKKIELNVFEYEVKDDNIGYIKISSFDDEVDSNFEKAYKELVEDKKVSGLIIDLRDNPGGVFDEVKNIANMLVPEGIITYTVDKNGQKSVAYADERKSSVPIVVLINNSSASASEILAAAIKDRNVGKVVGKTSYGKGLVQEFVNLRDGTYAKITIAEYFSPNGTKINKVGVVPDVEVDDDINTENDEQLEKAIEVLKNY